MATGLACARGKADVVPPPPQLPDDDVIVRGPKDRRADEINWETVEIPELNERASVYSYDLGQARGRVRIRANWVKIIVTHIYVDHILTELLRENLKNPGNYISDKRRKYVLDKLEVCDAMGWIDPSLKVIIKKLNSMRNELAHTLSFEISKKEIDGFINLFPAHMTSILKDRPPRPDGKKRGAPQLSDYLELFLILLDMNRQQVLTQKFRETHRKRELRKAMVNASRVLEKARSAGY